MDYLPFAVSLAEIRADYINFGNISLSRFGCNFIKSHM